ncbi:patatin-like phospholipase family protein [Pararhizobium mangrovi]|uniref:Patatin-like phospholipase family protein n=1 Tax=Pararhizobium mangrovi TaxID=2590452 RepID=A0A506TZK7_9HYPH|nr:patatin-like phospholipase family protein [Pararhizobium mangrovi]TPW26628.1 patatin-like phospholipase family protein [Pararhizobium mangrovi]
MIERASRSEPAGDAGGKATKKTVNLALQGGGAHGAFTWGVLDAILEDGRLEFEGISGTSAGAMNATVLAYGLETGGREGARQALAALWDDISAAGGPFSPLSETPWEAFFSPPVTGSQLAFSFFDTLTRTFSPYELNPLDINPLRDLLARHVDFEALAESRKSKLFLGATNVRTGRVKVFETRHVTLDAVMASACLPFLFKAVEIDGEYYWDGGYMGNPVLFPFFYKCDSRDVLILHVNPLERDAVPTSATEIMNRINEISFNGSLLKELRAIDFVDKLIDQGWLKDEFKDRLKRIHVHSVRSDKALSDLSAASKFNVDHRFLADLFERGRETGKAWLAHNFASIGERSSVSLKHEYLDDGFGGRG